MKNKMAWAKNLQVVSHGKKTDVRANGQSLSRVSDSMRNKEHFGDQGKNKSTLTGVLA